MHGMGGFAGGGPHHSMGGGPHAFMGGGPHTFMGGGPRAFMGGGPHTIIGGGPRAFMGGGPRAFMGGGPHGFMGGGPHGFEGGGPRGSMGPRVGGFGFRHDNPFFAHRFAGQNQFFPHNQIFTRDPRNQIFTRNQVLTRDPNNQVFTRDQVLTRGPIANNQVVANKQVVVKNQVFPNRRFFFAFDFVSFGFPWWYPYAVYYPQPYYVPPYDYSYNNSGQAYDYQYWSNLAVSVQSELARRGYYHGPLDGVIGSESSEAIRAFQAAQGLPVTGMIDPKLLNALGISYESG